MAIDAARISPDTERDRLRAVEQMSAMGTASEERFDQIIRVAKMMFNVPMSSISLVDDRHQWFKSVDGLADTPIPRDETVCQVTIARAYNEPQDPINVIEDVSELSDFASLPGVGGEDGVRFYAGHPLYGPGGHPVGVFCIYDSEPRILEPDDLTAFAELAKWAQNEMERSAELDRAAEVQRELLPREIAPITGYEIETLCLPAFSVGGDFYDYYTTEQGAFFSVVDVMGKGIGAAILTASVRSALRGSTRALAALPNPDLGLVLEVVSEQLSDDFDRTFSFATAFHARLDPSAHTLDYADAGQGLAFLRTPDGTMTNLATSDLPLGIGSGWEMMNVALDAGAMVIACSDGLLDIVSEDSDSEKLAAFLGSHQTPAAVVTAVESLARSTISLDDVTVVAIRRAA